MRNTLYSRRIIDITRELSPSIMVYPGDRVPEFIPRNHGAYKTTELILSSHSGTHIDAPSHYLETPISVDRISLDSLIGEAMVVDLSESSGAIDTIHLPKIPPGIRIILLKTSCSGKTTFEPGYSFLTMDAAKHLVVSGIQCIGVDTPSVEKFGGNGNVHKELLGHNVTIIELLDLSGVREGVYWLVALPLRLKGVDGSPARVVLFCEKKEE